jgi:serine phosphatase RsbU (regulator of sigma subunit)
MPQLAGAGREGGQVNDVVAEVAEDLLDGESVDQSFDRYARMVRRTLDVPVALVSIVEDSRQVFPGAVGLPEPFQTSRQTPLSHSFCQYVVKDNEPLVLPDARENARLCDNLAIEDLNVVAYAGWPLTDHAGQVIGSLCAIDSRRRVWTADELEALADLAAACSSEIAQRELRRIGEEREELARHAARRSEVLLTLSEGLSVTRTLPEIAAAVERVALDGLGCTWAGMWLRGIEPTDVVAPSLPDASVTETLTFVSHPETRLPDAGVPRELSLDRSGPLGEALASRTPLFHTEPPLAGDARGVVLTSDRSAQAQAFLPLVVSGRVYGALALLWGGPEEFLEEDRITMAALTSYVAQAVHGALLFQERMHASVTLERAMLTTNLPQPMGLELAARYRPAAARDQVGGDWYDAVLLSSGATSVMVGDVVGHDMAAAAMMGQLRNMLRAFAWALDEPPSRHVLRLDRAMHELDIDTYATLIFAQITMSDTGVPVMRWTNAGHPPPLLVQPEGVTDLLPDDGSFDCMLGVLPDGERRDHETTVTPGSTLLFYTDGLVERRDADIETGMTRLRRSIAKHRELPVEKLLDAVLDDLVEEHPEDDAALLAVRVLA